MRAVFAAIGAIALVVVVVLLAVLLFDIRIVRENDRVTQQYTVSVAAPTQVAQPVSTDSVSKKDLIDFESRVLTILESKQAVQAQQNAQVASAPAAVMTASQSLAVSTGCPKINGVSGSILPPNMCKYFFGSSMELTVPNGWWADAYLTDVGIARYGIQSGTTIQTVEMTLKPLSGTTLSSTAPSLDQQTAEKASAGQCPTTGQQIVDLLKGGKADKWTRPDATNAPGTWVYKDKGNLVQFTHPGFGQIDYWGGTAPASQTTVGNLPSHQDEITFKCEAAQ